MGAGPWRGLGVAGVVLVVSGAAQAPVLGQPGPPRAARLDGDRAAVSIVGADLKNLVGENGKVLEALQELTRLAVYRETGERSRLMLDDACEDPSGA